MEIEHLPPVTIERIGDCHWFVDFGKAVFGTVEIAPSSTLPGKHRIHLGEKLESPLRIDRHPAGSVRYAAIDVTAESDGCRLRVPIPPDPRNTGPRAIRMPPHIGEVMPFRYCEIEKYANLGFDDIRQVFVHAPFDDAAATFASSDPLLNEIWELCRHTIKATTFCGLYVDGDRERIPYEGDAYINQLSHFCLDADYRMAHATLEYLLFHPTWPTDWHLHVPMIAWDLLLHSGDDRIVREHYDLIKLKTLGDLADPSGLIAAENLAHQPRLREALGFDGFFGSHELKDLIDWPQSGFLSPELPGETDGYVIGRQNTAVNALHYRALADMSRIAAYLGKTGDAEALSRQAERVARAVNSLCFDPDLGIYRDGPGVNHGAQHANFFPLMAGLVPAPRVASVTDHIVSRGMACSVYGAQHMLDALYRARRPRPALALMTSQGKRSWWHMIQELGSTMTLEAWDAEYKPNLDWNHAWGTAPLNIIVRRLLGVRPSAPGFRRAIVDPQPGPLEWARARVPTPHGPIEIEVTGGESPQIVHWSFPPGIELEENEFGL